MREGYGSYPICSKVAEAGHSLTGFYTENNAWGEVKRAFLTA